MAGLSGKTLSGYKIRKSSGSGGMAIIYPATHIETGRLVALKVLFPDKARDQTLVKRFLREAKYAAGLKHPNIIPVYDSGRLPDGRPYIAMPWADGGSLTDWLEKKEHPIDPKKIGGILKRVSAALDYAHQRGVVHRDVKPSNILLTKKGDIWLTDFGIAKAGEDSPLTRQDEKLGTPIYMAPEQIRGQKVSPATDVYALGIVLYEMLANKPPFRGNTQAIMYQHINEAPPPVLKYDGNLPPAVERVISKALAKDPKKRYQRSGQLTADFYKAMSMPAPGGKKGLILGGLGALVLLIALAVFIPALLKNGAEPTPPSTGGAPVVVAPTPTEEESGGNKNTPTIATATAQGAPPSPTVAPPSPTPIPDAPPQLLSPRDGEKFTGGEAVVLRWTSDIDPDQERFQISWQSDKGAAGEAHTAGTSYSLSNLKSGGYTWMVVLQQRDGVNWREVNRSQSRAFSVQAPPVKAPSPSTPTKSPAGDCPIEERFTLLKPTLNTSSGEHPVEFEWRWSGELPDTCGFEVRVWRKDEEPLGAHDALKSNKNGDIQAVGDKTYRLIITDLRGVDGISHRPGEYFWTVGLVELEPAYKYLGVEAKPGLLRVD